MGVKQEQHACIFCMHGREPYTLCWPNWAHGSTPASRGPCCAAAGGDSHKGLKGACFAWRGTCMVKCAWGSMHGAARMGQCAWCNAHGAQNAQVKQRLQSVQTSHLTHTDLPAADSMPTTHRHTHPLRGKLLLAYRRSSIGSPDEAAAGAPAGLPPSPLTSSPAPPPRLPPPPLLVSRLPPP